MTYRPAIGPGVGLPESDEEARECVERLGIDVTTWAAEVRAKVLAALGDNLPAKETTDV